MLPLIALNHGYKNCFLNGSGGGCTFELNANTAPLTDGEPNFGNSTYIDMDYWLDEQNPKPPVPETPAPLNVGSIPGVSGPVDTSWYGTTVAVAGAFWSGLKAGATEVAYKFSLPGAWVSGKSEYEGMANARQQAWADSGLDGTWTQYIAQSSANVGVGAAYAAGAVATANFAGTPTMNVAVGTGKPIHVGWSVGKMSAQTKWYHGSGNFFDMTVKSVKSTDTLFWGGTHYFTVTRIPILFPEIATSTFAGKKGWTCVTLVGRAFLRGWFGPF